MLRPSAIRRRRQPAYPGFNYLAKPAVGATQSPTRPATIGAGGGIGPRPAPKPDRVIAGGYTQPPVFTYDPAIEAQRRSVKRGLEDKLQDVRTGRHFNQTDLAQALRDIKVNTQRSRGKIIREAGRSRGDINRESQRASEGLSERESDERLSASRANEDFDTQLANIARQFGDLGRRQSESANAAGVLGSGTEAASAVARGRNQAIAEAPIATARKRVEEDLATALRRLGVKRGELGEDTERSLKELLEDQQRGLGQLKQDRNRERRLSRRETGRKEFGLTRESQRARREATISDVDLIMQEIFQARQNRPGAFTKTGQRNRKGRR